MFGLSLLPLLLAFGALSLLYSVGNSNGKTNNSNNTQLITFLINNDTITKKETNEYVQQEKNKSNWTKIKKRLIEDVGNSTTKQEKNKMTDLKLNDKNDKGPSVKLKSGLFESLVKMLTPKLKGIIDDDGKTNDDDDVYSSKTINKREKPFIFFKFSYKIRKSPFANVSGEDKKLIYPKKSNEMIFPKSFLPFDTIEKDFFNDGQKENAEVGSFLDDFSMFPDGAFGDLFQNADALMKNTISDGFPFKKKLKRIKRTMKKSGNVKNNDIKLITDILNEPFFNIRDFNERENPFVKFFDDIESEKNKFFARETKDDLNEKQSNGNIKIQRNVKYLNKNRYKKPITVIDEIIFKTKEPQLRDNFRFGLGEFKKTVKNDKRDEDSMNKIIDVPLRIEDEAHERDNNRVHKLSLGKIQSDDESQQSKNLKNKRHVERNTNENIDEYSNKDKKLEDTTTTMITTTEETKKMKKKQRVGNDLENQVAKIIRKVVNSSENILNYADNIVKMIDNIKSDAQKTLMNNKENGKTSTHNKNEKKRETYDNVIAENITDVLKKFLMSSEKTNEDEDESGLFEWAQEKILKKEKLPWGRSKKNPDFVEDYINQAGDTRKIADINNSFLTVTLPTIGISLVLLMFCFFNLRIRGQLCRKLFKPRRVFVFEDGQNPMQGN